VRPIMTRPAGRAARFPFEPAVYEPVPDELPGFWPEEPGKLMVPAI
jgi:hypothetical protein